MEWVASTLHTTSEHGVSSITTADVYISAASSQLNRHPRRFKWTHSFPERQNLVYAHVPSHFKQSLPPSHLIQILKISQDSFPCDLEVPVVLSEPYA